ncbi:sulfotransferase domain-containing protein [Spirulina sp. 06S082]|uniref:sulfotransferase domain-containing protein n=1 Tax=Spirulina sp. 06S082 TaxID=3110248 RepID=UPI002B21E566|nr:sulfotransferase domain-containing protein [Spirulina sp. 06S082]MEA5469989.1 sulfotransferase domain-containing protein [Spirulina sp. 06S082]
MSDVTMKLKERIFINSLPKSGTHLLAKAIEIFGYEEHFSDRPNLEDNSESITPILLNRREVIKALKKENLTPNLNEGISIGALTDLFVQPSILQHWLEAIAPGKYILGHIPQTPLLHPLLEAIGCHHVFIIRDPRAVVASSIPFFLDTGKMPARHFLEDDIKSLSQSDRINFVLEGGYAKNAGVTIKSFAEVYRSMLAWRDRPDCLFLHFEDLVGEGGGGSNEKQMQAIERIALHLGVSFGDRLATKVKEIYNPNSRTFRKGQIDSWKTALDAELVQRLIEYCQPLCLEAGYPNL